MPVNGEQVQDAICALNMLDQVGKRSDQEAIALAVFKGRAAYIEMTLQLRTAPDSVSPLFVSLMDGLRARLRFLGARV